MKERYRHSTSQLLNFAKDSYLDRTSRPIYAIIFLLPFIVFYEVGTILFNTDVLNQSQVRVVAFGWLQNLLEYMGSSDKLAWVAPPVAVVVILVALQLSSRKPWRFSFGDLWPMGIECILLAVPLIVLSLFLNNPPKPQDDIGQFDDSAKQFRQASWVTHDAKLQLYNAHFDKRVLSCSSITGKSLLSAAVETDSGEVKSDSLLASFCSCLGSVV
jgi:hypothetical protein